MDLSLPQSKSVPSNLSANRRHRVSISGLGSYQSHLSSLGHFHRVRSTSEQASLSPALPEKDYLHVLEEGLPEDGSRVGRLCWPRQSVTDPATFLSDDLRRILNGHVWRLRTLVTLYCCLSVLFLSIRIYTLSKQAFQVTRPLYSPSLGLIPNHGTSLMNISLSQRLSVAFRGLPSQAHLETFVVQAHPSYKSDLAACLWIEDTRIEEALASATAWPGPVSLLVVTTNAPNVTAYKNLLGHLLTKPPTNACIHLLYVPSITGVSSNTYLNMARFFALTARVILFPDGIPTTHDVRWADGLPRTRHPVLLGRMRKFAPRPLTPVVLPRDYPVWCTERLYMFGARALDWEDCLWELWLDSAGEALLVATRWDARNATSAISVPPFAMKTRLRWSTRYRAEVCAFALKRSHALGSLSRTEKRQMQWKRKFCRETVGPGGLE